MPKFALFAIGRLVKNYDIEKDEILIGRLAGLEIELPLATVSRKHARIVKEGDRYCLEDLKSINGVRVNGTRVSKCYLLPGDKIEIESFSLIYEPTDLQGTDDPGQTSPEIPVQTDKDDKDPLDLTFLNINKYIDDTNGGDKGND